MHDLFCEDQDSYNAVGETFGEDEQQRHHKELDIRVVTFGLVEDLTSWALSLQEGMLVIDGNRIPSLINQVVAMYGQMGMTSEDGETFTLDSFVSSFIMVLNQSYAVSIMCTKEAEPTERLWPKPAEERTAVRRPC